MAGRLVRAVVVLGLLLFVGSAFAAATPMPLLSARITDQTATLSSADAQALEDKLAAFEQTKGGQIAVLIVPTTGDETIEQYSIRVVDAWKLGRKGVDDGVLLVVAKGDRKLRIEVGRGYEGVLPDAIANRIIDEFITPKFLAGDYAGGLNDGIDRIIGVVNGGALPQPPKVASGAAVEFAAAATPIPELVGHVVNRTRLITTSQAFDLDEKLTKFEASKGARIAVLLIDNIADETVDHYTDRVFAAWQLDGPRKDSVLLLESEEPFGDRIVVGRDLEGTITPDIIHRIKYEFMSPKMIRGDTAGGLEAGVDRIIDLENGKSLPPKPENSIDWGMAADWFSPPPFGTWIIVLVGMIFLGVVAAAVLGHQPTLLRGGATGLVVGVVPLIAGAGALFALCFAALAAYLSGKYAEDDGPPIDWSSDDGRASSVSGWDILGTIAGGLVSSAVSGGGGGFSGGGGGFSGGGASGSW